MRGTQKGSEVLDFYEFFAGGGMARAGLGDLHDHPDRSAQLHRPGGLAARRAHPHRGRAPGQPHRRTRAVELEHFKVSWPSEPDAWLEEAPAQL